MPKFARSDEPKVNQCQINDKCLNPKTFCSQICLVENLFGRLDFEFHLNFGL
jgi:hypothetical protein